MRFWESTEKHRIQILRKHSVQRRENFIQTRTLMTQKPRHASRRFRKPMLFSRTLMRDENTTCLAMTAQAVLLGVLEDSKESISASTIYSVVDSIRYSPLYSEAVLDKDHLEAPTF